MNKTKKRNSFQTYMRSSRVIPTYLICTGVHKKIRKPDLLCAIAYWAMIDFRVMGLKPNSKKVSTAYFDYIFRNKSQRSDTHLLKRECAWLLYSLLLPLKNLLRCWNRVFVFRLESAKTAETWRISYCVTSKWILNLRKWQKLQFLYHTRLNKVWHYWLR